MQRLIICSGNEVRREYKKLDIAGFFLLPFMLFF